MSEPKPKPKKQQKNFYLTSEAVRMLAAVSEKMGVNESAIIEILVREKGAKEGVQ